MITIIVNGNSKSFESKRKSSEYYRDNEPCICRKCGTKFYIGSLIFHTKFSEVLDYSNAQCGACNIKDFNTSEYCKQCRSEQLTNQWKDPEFRANQTNRASEQLLNLWDNPNFAKSVSDRMSANHKDINFLISMYESRGWDLQGLPGSVYLVKYDDYIKVGFTQDIDNRITWLGNPELICIKKFNKGVDALIFEQKIHKDNIDKSIDSECYPISMLEYFKSLLN